MLTWRPNKEGLLRAQLLGSSQCSIEQVGSRAGTLVNHLLMFLGNTNGPLDDKVDCIMGGKGAPEQWLRPKLSLDLQEEAFSSS